MPPKKIGGDNEKIRNTKETLLVKNIGVTNPHEIQHFRNY